MPSKFLVSVLSVPKVLPLVLVLHAARAAAALQNIFNLPNLGFPPAANTANALTPAPLKNRVDLGSLSVSPMGLGTLNLPLNKETDDETTAILRSAMSVGVNLVDTAEAYGFGKSETMTANSCRDAGLKIGCDGGDSTVAVATKFAPVPWRPDGSSVVDACKASAKRLGVDQIPLYQIHWPDKIQYPFGLSKPKDELYWDGLAECYESGLAANVGVSNYGPETLLRAHEALSKRGVPITSNQINLSLLRYRSSEATLKTCEELGVKVLAYFPLANGLLAGKYETNPPKWPKSVTMKKYMDDTAPLLSVLRRIAKEREKTAAQISINWVMMTGAIPIPGARSAKMAEDNFSSLGWALTEEEVDELERAAAGVGEFSSGGFELV